MLPQTDAASADVTKFFDKITTYLCVEDRLRVKKAFELARREHGEQRRKTGELFFTHPLTVAYYLSEYHLDAAALEAALLHDVAEDTRVSINEIQSEFGPEVARLVDGVTKLKDVTEGVAKGQHLPPQELRDKTLHKLFSAMTEDVRTVIIKLFDRLHNMRTIRALPPHKQRQKAEETLAVYAPLANRLGLWRLKNELEALSLEVLENSAYNAIKRRREEMERAHQEIFHILSGQIFTCLLQAEIDVRNVVLAPENIYTIFQDIAANGASYDDVDRTIRLVVLVNEWTECYQALGHLHQLWRPVPGTFDDYIAVPRDNLYRSLHTTLIHSHGQQVKVRIRTVAMDKVSEIGVLARWLYAGTPLWSKGIAERIEAFFENISENINLEPQNPAAGVKWVLEDMLRKQIRVFTPRGETVELGQGATVVDFAYAIHTGLGNQTHAAYVNDAYYPLNKPLKDGDQVRIVKKSRAQPQRSWLDDDLGYIATNYARSHARRWFRRLPAQRAIDQGRVLVQTELNILGYPDFSHQELAEALEFAAPEQLYYAVGRAEVLPTAVANRVLEYKWGTGPGRSVDVQIRTETDGEVFITKSPTRRLRLCGTCHPRPPQQIVGFMRRDGGLTVHKERCHLLRAERGRVVKLGWGEATREAREVTVQIDVYDRPGLLYDITQLMEDEQINISYIHTPPRRGGEMQLILTLEVLDPRQLVRILHQIHALPNIFDLRCLPEGPPDEPHNGAAPLYLPE